MKCIQRRGVSDSIIMFIYSITSKPYYHYEYYYRICRRKQRCSNGVEIDCTQTTAILQHTASSLFLWLPSAPAKKPILKMFSFVIPRVSEVRLRMHVKAVYWVRAINAVACRSGTGKYARYH